MGNFNIKADGKGESYSVLAKENRTDDVEGERGKGRKGWQWHKKENGIAKKTRYWVQRSPALSRRWIRYRPSSGTQWMLNLLIVKSHWGIKRTLSSVLVFVLQNKPLSPPLVPPRPSLHFIPHSLLCTKLLFHSPTSKKYSNTSVYFLPSVSMCLIFRLMACGTQMPVKNYSMWAILIIQVIVNTESLPSNNKNKYTKRCPSSIFPGTAS